MSDTDLQDDAQEPQTDDAAVAAEAVEKEARDMGWRPKEEWKGRAEDWRDAGEFVKRGQEILPVVQSRLQKERAAREKAESRIAELEAKFEKASDTLARMDRMTAKALDQQKKQLTAKFEDEKRKAVELGDTEAFDRATRKEREALQELHEDTKEAIREAKEDEKKLPTGIAAKDKAALDEWLGENEWFKTSARLRGAADDHFEDVKKEMPGATMADKLAEVRKRVEDEFPDKFGKAKPVKRGGGVESGVRVAGNGGGGSLYSKLPAEAKAQADSFIKEDGLFLKKGETVEKNLGEARERYAKSFFQDNKDAA